MPQAREPVPRSGTRGLALAALLASVVMGACDSTGPGEDPDAPRGLAADAASDRSIALAWTLGGGSATELRLERAVASGAFAAHATLAGSQTTYLDEALEPATRYRYRLRACRATSCSEPGPVGAATTFTTLALDAAALPAGRLGSPYRASLAAAAPGATFASVGGTLPPGLVLGTDGTLGGTPTAAGTFAFSVRATGSGPTSVGTARVTVWDLLTVTTTALPGGVAGRAYAVTLTAAGGDAAYTWTAEGALPAGLALSAAGLLSGTPLAEQSARFTVRVRSGDGQTAVRELTLAVAPAGSGGLLLRTTLLPPAVVGLRYQPVLRVSGAGTAGATWAIVAGSPPPGVSLGANGAFTGTPTQAGTATFTVRATADAGSAEATFTVRVDPNDPVRFNLGRFDVAPVPAAIAPHVAAAFARWETVIVGELASDSIPRGFFASSDCGGFGAAVNGTGIEDVLVLVNIGAIDGAGSILGQAGPCAYREDDALPAVGILTLDADDLATLAGTTTLTDIVFHEIGHILGVGTLWEGWDCGIALPACEDRLEGEAGSDPTFTGPEAVREWQALGGTGAVPVENVGGSGTALAHWRETVFDAEIMTGFVERADAPNPLSRVTIASLADLGFRVRYDAADAFSLPPVPPPGAPAAQALTAEGWEIPLPEPPRRLPGR